jgi:hypothetical protein
VQKAVGFRGDNRPVGNLEAYLADAERKFAPLRAYQEQKMLRALHLDFLKNG